MIFTILMYISGIILPTMWQPSLPRRYLISRAGHTRLPLQVSGILTVFPYTWKMSLLTWYARIPLTRWCSPTAMCHIIMSCQKVHWSMLQVRILSCRDRILLCLGAANPWYRYARCVRVAARPLWVKKYARFCESWAGHHRWSGIQCPMGIWQNRQCSAFHRTRTWMKWTLPSRSGKNTRLISMWDVRYSQVWIMRRYCAGPRQRQISWYGTGVITTFRSSNPTWASWWPTPTGQGTDSHTTLVK